MKLYEINHELRTALENVELDEETGEVFGFDKIDELQEMLDEKLEACSIYYKEMIAEADALKLEENRLKERRIALGNKAESFKQYIANNMLFNDRDKLETSKVKLSFRKSESIEIIDFDKLDKAFVKEKVNYDADKVEIKKAIKAGIEVKGAKLVSNQNLIIK